MERLKFWRDRNVFVTGGTGFIGSNLCIDLERLGANVVILKRDHVKNSLLSISGLENKVNIVNGDVENFNLILRVLTEYEVDTVFHLGAQTIVKISRVAPLETFEANIKGTANILEACRIVRTESDQLKYIVVASSDKSYGESDKLPYTEDMQLFGESPYDISKSCTDMISRSYHKVYGLPVCISRAGNVFGPGDMNFNRLIPGTIKSIINDEEILIRSDGTNIREYFYVKDAIDSYLTLAENMGREEILGHAFNFGSGEKMTVLEVVNKILEIMKSDKMPKILNTAKNEINAQMLSIEKAKKMLAWRPQHTFDNAIKETIEWYRNFFAKYQKS